MLNSIRLYEEAVIYCKRAIELNPGHIEACNSLGVSYRNLGKGDESIESFKRVIELEPNHLGANNNLALIYCYDKKLFDLSRSHWEKVLEIDPDNANARKYLENIEKGME